MLRKLFLPIGYPKRFFDVFVKKFKLVNKPNPSNKNNENIFLPRLGVSYFGGPSHNFGCNVANLI